MMPARELSRSLSPGDQTGTTNLPGMIRDSSPPGRGRRIGHHGRTPGDPRCQFKQPTLTRRFTPPSPAGRGGLGVGHLVAPVRSPALPRFALKLQCAVSRRQIASLAKSTPMSASTQNQALSAILFLYRNVLDDPLPWLSEIVRSVRPRRLPVVLTKDEVRAILAEMDGTPKLVASLLYGTGMRLLEGLRLRVKDLDFETGEVVVRGGKGNKDRATTLPRVLSAGLQRHMERVRALHDRDVSVGFGRVWLPDALEVKYPNANASWSWQWVFPAGKRSI